MAPFFEELKRRNVFRVGTAYLIVAWLLAQVAEYGVDVFGAPGWVLKSFTILLLLGFPVALILAWAFELTPEGIKRDQDVADDRRAVGPGGRKIDFVIIGVLAVLVIYLGIERFFGGPIDTGADAASGGPTAAHPAIAVLPFSNLSSDPENEYFADGLSEELLIVLARIEGLKVTGRTSSFYFKGKNEDLRIIGEKLGVNHILEGSVRKSGDSVRITTQLIKAEDGFNLWSETYDRKLVDIFTIQDEIARSVADALKAELLGEEGVAVDEQSELSPEIYARFIAAKSRMATRGRDNLIQAHESLVKITEEVPSYGPGHAARAVAVLLRWRITRTVRLDAARAEAKEAVERALALAPNDDDVHMAHGVYLSELDEYASEAGLAEVNEVFRHAIRLNPENVDARHFLAFNLLYLEQFEEAGRQLDEILRIDPLAKPSRVLKLWQLSGQGRLDEAIRFARHSIELLPEEQVFYERAGSVEQRRGRPDRALAWTVATEKAFGSNQGLMSAKLEFAHMSGYDQGVEEALEALERNDSPLAVMYRLSQQGQFERLVDVIDEKIEADGWGAWERWRFLFAALAERCDAAFESRFAGRLLAEWSEGEPKVDNTNDNRALLTANCLRRQGLADQAEKLIRASLDYYLPRDGRFDGPDERLGRVAAYNMLGERKRAIDAFRAYHEDGFSFMTYVPLELDPLYAGLIDDPEFQALLSDNLARKARRLQQVIDSGFSIDALL